MFRSSTTIRELALNLAKVIFMLEHSVKLRRYLLMRLCGSMLPHNRIINNDVFQFCVSVHHIMINKNTSLMQPINIYFTYSETLHVSGRTLPIIRRI